MTIRQNNLEIAFRNGKEGKRVLENPAVTSPILSDLFRKILAWERDFWNVHLHIWYWLPRTYEVPFRLPALMIPALEILASLKKLGLTKLPKLIVYQATDFIINANKLEKDKAEATSLEMLWILETFVDRNFPWSKRQCHI